MARGGFICSRNTLILLNILYFAVGVMLIALAAYCKALAIITTLPVMGAIIACGVFLSIIAVVGVVGAAKHHQVSLFFYMVILFLIFLLQFSVACVCLSLSKHQEQNFFQLGWKLASNDLKMSTQEMFVCCGMDVDHQVITAYNKEYNHPDCSSIIPQCIVNNLTLACCQEFHPSHNLSTTLSTTPSTIFSNVSTSLSSTSTISSHSTSSPQCPASNCWSVVQPRLHQLVRMVGVISLVFSFTELIGIWLTFRYRNQKDPTANPSAFL